MVGDSILKQRLIIFLLVLFLSSCLGFSYYRAALEEGLLRDQLIMTSRKTPEIWAYVDETDGDDKTGIILAETAPEYKQRIVKNAFKTRNAAIQAGAMTIWIYDYCIDRPEVWAVPKVPIEGCIVVQPPTPEGLNARATVETTMSMGMPHP